VNVRSNRAEADAVVREIEAAGGKALVHIGDVADDQIRTGDADAAVKQFGLIDIWQHAAPRREKPFAAMSYASGARLWMSRSMHFHASRLLPALRQSGAGTIVNNRWLSGPYRREKSRACGYREGGHIGFTRALAHDLADDGSPSMRGSRP